MSDPAPEPIRSGYVLIDKPVGPSSHGAVQQVRRTLGLGGKRGTKAGHAGTLDPFASGLLVVLLGRATRLMPLIVGHDKRYLVDVRFGASSTTDDREGELTPSGAPRPTAEDVRRALPALAAATEQVPPAVSALHVDGVRAYQRVRRGETIEVPARAVRIDRIDLVDWRSGDDPVAVLDVACATGTYMRALARDLGLAVGCPAHCSELRRLEVGEWTVDSACAPAHASRDVVRDARELLDGMPELQLDEHGVDDVAAGRRLPMEDELRGLPTIALIAPDGSLAAIAEPTSDGTLLQPRTVLVDPPAVQPAR